MTIRSQRIKVAPFCVPIRVFRDRVSRDGGSGFKAERGRYQLVTAPSCPWAHRTVLMRRLKGLDDAIPCSNPICQREKAGPIHAALTISAKARRFPCPSSLYRRPARLHRPRHGAGVVGPQDKDDRQQRVVRDHPHAELGIRRIRRCGARSLPDVAAERIDETNAFVYDNDQQWGLSRRLGQDPRGLRAKLSQSVYGVRRTRSPLGRQRYLVGDRFTEADLRLFPTLVRFDAVYYVLFKCNLRRLADYHNLSNYTRDIYQMPGVAATVDFRKIKLGYYGGMRTSIRGA